MRFWNKINLLNLFLYKNLAKIGENDPKNGSMRIFSVFISFAKHIYSTFLFLLLVILFTWHIYLRHMEIKVNALVKGSEILLFGTLNT